MSFLLIEVEDQVHGSEGFIVLPSGPFTWKSLIRVNNETGRKCSPGRS